jgi:AraC-like DNA-binding protein
MLLAISEYILGEKREYIENKNISHSTWQYVHQACAYISAHATENITQSGVAKTIGLSTYYFSKIFKECMQMSFPAYLSNVRVRNATNLLANEELSITECAFQSGFQSTSAFNKLFHDYMGCSPRDYRSMYHKRA